MQLHYTWYVKVKHDHVKSLACNVFKGIEFLYCLRMIKRRICPPGRHPCQYRVYERARIGLQCCRYPVHTANSVSRSTLMPTCQLPARAGVTRNLSCFIKVFQDLEGDLSHRGKENAKAIHYSSKSAYTIKSFNLFQAIKWRDELCAWW